MVADPESLPSLLHAHTKASTSTALPGSGKAIAAKGQGQLSHPNALGLAHPQLPQPGQLYYAQARCWANSFILMTLESALLLKCLQGQLSQDAQAKHAAPHSSQIVTWPQVAAEPKTSACLVVKDP